MAPERQALDRYLIKPWAFNFDQTGFRSGFASERIVTKLVVVRQLLGFRESD